MEESCDVIVVSSEPFDFQCIHLTLPWQCVKSFSAFYFYASSLYCILSSPRRSLSASNRSSPPSRRFLFKTLRIKTSGTMGGSSSKSDPHSSARNVQNSFMESSTGFHQMEVHFPTLGPGIGLVVLGAILLHLCVKKFGQRKTRSSRKSYFDSNFEAEHGGFPMHQFPMISMSHFAPTPYPCLLQPRVQGPPRLTEIEEETETGTSKKTKK